MSGKLMETNGNAKKGWNKTKTKMGTTMAMKMRVKMGIKKSERFRAFQNKKREKSCFYFFFFFFRWLLNSFFFSFRPWKAVGGASNGVVAILLLFNGGKGGI